MTAVCIPAGQLNLGGAQNRSFFTYSLLAKERKHHSSVWTLRLWRFDPQPNVAHVLFVVKTYDMELDDMVLQLAQPQATARELLFRDVEPVCGSMIAHELMTSADPDIMTVGDEHFLDHARIKHPLQNVGPITVAVPPPYNKPPVTVSVPKGQPGAASPFQSGGIITKTMKVPHGTPAGTPVYAIDVRLPAAKAAPCDECGGTGYYESPLTGAKSPCSQGCKHP